MLRRLEVLGVLGYFVNVEMGCLSLSVQLRRQAERKLVRLLTYLVRILTCGRHMMWKRLGRL